LSGFSLLTGLSKQTLSLIEVGLTLVSTRGTNWSRPDQCRCQFRSINLFQSYRYSEQLITIVCGLISTCRSALQPCRRSAAVSQSLGSRLLNVSTEGFDLISQLSRSTFITAGHGDRQGELQLFKLMTTLNETLTTAGQGQGAGRTDGSAWSTGAGVGECHGRLSFYFDTPGQPDAIAPRTPSGRHRLIAVIAVPLVVAMHLVILVVSCLVEGRRIGLTQQVLTLLQD